MRSWIRKNYAWVVCGACLLLYFCAVGLVTTAFSTYTPYLKARIGLTNTETSMITTVRCIMTMAALPLTGKLYGKVSLKTGSLIAVALMAISCIVFAHAGNAVVCYAAAGIMGFSYAFGSMVPISQMMVNWFEDQRSTALAVTTCGSSLSTAIVPPIITSLTENYGLTITFYLEAVFIVASMVVLGMLLHDKPEDIGLEPFRKKGGKAGKKQKRVLPRISLTKWEVVFFAAACFLIGWCGAPYTHHLTIHYVTVGYSSVQAALALSIYGAVMVGGKFFYGVFADRFGAEIINYVFIGAWIMAAFLTAWLTGNAALPLNMSAVLNGIGIPVGTIGITVWCDDFSSKEEYAGRVRFSQTIFTMGSIIGSVVPGILADMTGSYAGAYYMFAIMLIITLVIVQTLYIRRIRRA